MPKLNGKKNPAYRHGMYGTKTYQSWASMLARCTNPNAPQFCDYGGRGIKVCKRWYLFSNFLADMGVRPKNKTIDRINNDGDYELDNCRWATRKQQNNNSRHNRFVVVGGISKTVEDWSRVSGIEQSTLSHRLRLGWPPEHFLLPVGTRRTHG